MEHTVLVGRCVIVGEKFHYPQYLSHVTFSREACKARKAHLFHRLRRPLCSSLIYPFLLQRTTACLTHCHPAALISTVVVVV